MSAFAGAYYSPEFVRAVLECVLSAFRDAPVVAIVEDSLLLDQWNEVRAVNKPSEAELQEVLKCLHKNLGHPPNSDLVRILKLGQASPEAIDAARCFECDFCKSQAKPGGPLPAQLHRVHEFKYQIGLDVNNLQGWLPNQRVKALNIVDTASSSFQRMIPFFEIETSALLRKLLADHWIAWAGPPQEIVLDPARTNLGDQMAAPCELEGTLIRSIAAGAHWQLGKPSHMEVGLHTCLAR